MEQIRAAFREALGAFLDVGPGAPEPKATLDGEELPLGELAQTAVGLHQHLPDHLCGRLGIPVGSSYSQAAKQLQGLIRERALAAAG